MIVSGVFERIPDLRIYLAETNAGWIPEALYMMDDSYPLFKDWYGADLKLLPSEYARRHFLFGIVRDPAGAEDARPAPWRTSCGARTSPLGVVLPESPALARHHLRRRARRGAPPGARRHPVRHFHLDPAAALTPTLRRRPCSTR